MKKYLAPATILMAGILLAQSGSDQKQDAEPVSVTGKWSMTMEMSMGTATPSLEITRQDGEKIAGTYTGRYGTFALEGKVQKRTIEFTISMVAEGQNVTMHFHGEVAADGQSIVKGTADLGEAGEATWSAKKVKS